MSQAPEIAPIKGFDVDITADGGVAAETKILALWSQTTSQEAAAEAGFALAAQDVANALYDYQAKMTSGIITAMENPDNLKQKTGTVEQMLQARLQSIQSAINSQTQIANSARDDANNKQQNLATNDLVTTAMDPNNKVASLVTSLGPAI